MPACSIPRRQSVRQLSRHIVSDRAFVVVFAVTVHSDTANMLGFHRRTRSLIPVKDLAKYDKVPTGDEEEDVYGMEAIPTHEMPQVADKTQHRQLLLVYLVFLAEA